MSWNLPPEAGTPMPAGERDFVPLSSSGHADGEPVRVPPYCLSFTVSGDWGHFRRGEGNIVKRTHRVPPRTTVTGIVAAILGLPRDQYYELFAKGNSAVAISPVVDERIRTINVPMNTLDTMESMKSINSRGRGPTVQYPDSRESRKQHTYEYLIDPAYRIDLWMETESAYDRLRSHLRRGTNVYSPSLGLSELLATVTYHGEVFDIKPIDLTDPTDGNTEVESVLWGGSRCAVGQRGTSLRVERAQAFFSPAVDESGRLDRAVSEFIDMGYTPDGSPLPATNGEFADVDGRVVMFL